jgi:hypothetical protein
VRTLVTALFAGVLFFAAGTKQDWVLSLAEAGASAVRRKAVHCPYPHEFHAPELAPHARVETSESSE